MKATIKNLKELKELSINNEVRFEFKGDSYFIDASIVWVNGFVTVLVHNLVDSDIQSQVWSVFISDMKSGVEITITH